MTATIRLWVAAIGAVLAMAALAHADIDTDSASQLHGYGIYGGARLQRVAGQDRLRTLGSGLTDAAGSRITR